MTKPRIPDPDSLQRCEVCGKLIGAKGYFPTCLGHEPPRERPHIPSDHWGMPPR
jgi:hypothetical protein